jgi:arginine deiminase
MSEPARRFGSHSMVAPLERVLMAEPGPELESADPRVWNYSAPIDLRAARNESATLQDILRCAGVKVDLLPDEPGSLTAYSRTTYR